MTGPPGFLLQVTVPTGLLLAVNLAPMTLLRDCHLRAKLARPLDSVPIAGVHRLVPASKNRLVPSARAVRAHLRPQPSDGCGDRCQLTTAWPEDLATRFPSLRSTALQPPPSARGGTPCGLRKTDRGGYWRSAD